MGEKGEKQKRMREDDMSVHAEALLEQQKKHLKIKNQKKKGKHTVLKALGVSDPPQQQKFERKLLFLRVADCCATPWPPASVD